MKSFTFALLAALPLCAQGTVGHWNLDVHSMNGTLAGHYQGVSDGNNFLVDLKDDLGLTRDKAKPGFGLEYQGHRFGLELSVDGQDFAGSKVVTRKVTIDGTNFNVGARVNSTVKSRTTVFNWTIRALTWEHVWLGIDLGARGLSLDMAANGNEPFTGVTAKAAYKISYPVPQLGLSAGFNAFGGRLVGRGYFHELKYRGASDTVKGADLRFFPISWLGVRAFTVSEEMRVPKGALDKDIDIALDQSGSGFGVVFRF